MAFQEFGPNYRPDAITVGKALSGGLIAIAALVGTNDFMQVFTPGCDGSTFGGYPPACAVAVAVMEYLEEHPLGARAREIGQRFAGHLAGIPRVTITYRGALMAIEIRGLSSPKPLCRSVLSDPYKKRVIMKPGHVYTDPHTNIPRSFIRIAPPILAITDEMIDEACVHTIRPALERAVASL